MTNMSATASHFKIVFIGVLLISFRVSTMMFRMLAIVPNIQTYRRKQTMKAFLSQPKLKIVLNLIQHNFNEHQLNLCLPEVCKHAVKRDHILFML